MSNKGYTTGKWRQSSSAKTEVNTDSGIAIAECGMSMMISLEEKAYNAKLIAAAPDLLEALRPLADPGFLEALRHEISSLTEKQEDAIIEAFKKATE